MLGDIPMKIAILKWLKTASFTLQSDDSFIIELLVINSETVKIINFILNQNIKLCCTK